MSHHLAVNRPRSNLKAHLLVLGAGLGLAALAIAHWPSARTPAWVLLAAAVAAHVGIALFVLAGLYALGGRTLRNRNAGTNGTIRWAFLYDVLVKTITLGREHALRAAMLDAGNLTEGERVLDVGCGTGTLALAAKRRVGAAGTVRGLDAAPEMIARATAKAARAGLDASFEVAAAEALPFPDESFDVVFCTLVLHHLGADGPRRAVGEMRRVLRPGGRLIVVELSRPAGVGAALNPIALVHGHDDQGILHEAEALLREAGFAGVTLGGLGFRALGYVRGTRETGDASS